MKTPIFSILIPTIPSRIETFLIPLLRKLQNQVEDYPVEILSLLDNKKRSVGLKRDALVQSARGEFLVFVDDDDDISDCYISSILGTINENPETDLIVFNQICTINNGNAFMVKFGMEYENEDAGFDDNGIWRDIVRAPFHPCVWRTSIAQKEHFPDASYGEDWHWSKRVAKYVQHQSRINKVIHYYKYNDKTTEADLIFPDDQKND